MRFILHWASLILWNVLNQNNKERKIVLKKRTFKIVHVFVKSSRQVEKLSERGGECDFDLERNKHFIFQDVQYQEVR